LKIVDSSLCIYTYKWSGCSGSSSCYE